MDYKALNENQRKRMLQISKNDFSKTIKTAQSKKKYYVRVRAYTKAGGEKAYGAWSSVKAVYVK